MKKLYWGVLAGVGALAACSSDAMKPEASASAPDGAPHGGGTGGGHASGGAAAGGSQSGGRATGGTGNGRKDAGAIPDGSANADRDAPADGSVVRDTGPASAADASPDGDAPGNSVTFEMTFDPTVGLNGVQFVDTPAMEPPTFTSPLMWKDELCSPHDLTVQLATTIDHEKWEIPASNCGVEFLIQIYPSYTYSYVLVTPGSGLSCKSLLDNGVGPYFDCSMKAQAKLTQFEITASTTPLTGAGVDFQTFVH